MNLIKKIIVRLADLDELEHRLKSNIDVNEDNTADALKELENKLKANMASDRESLHAEIRLLCKEIEDINKKIDKLAEHVKCNK